MRISAQVRNGLAAHEAVVSTAGSTQAVAVPPKRAGPGSAVNGGEFLMLALATCYCNDVYREAARQNIPIDSVEVEASAEFAGVGLAASDITYRARVASPAAPALIEALLRQTDAVAEVHNTLRAGAAVVMQPWQE